MPKPASDKQLQYLKTIRERMGQEQPKSDFVLTSKAASLLIEQLERQREQAEPSVQVEKPEPQIRRFREAGRY